MPVIGRSGCAGIAGELSCSLGLQSEVTVYSFAENLAAFTPRCICEKLIRRHFIGLYLT